MKIRKNALFMAAIAGNYRPVFPLCRKFQRRFPRLSTDKTEICIEGFPRSGNSYFVSAFHYWNKDVELAHHSHLAGSVKYAIDRKLPAVVLIRKPEDTVASALAWDGLLNVNVALMSYLSFYNSLWRDRDRLLVLRFENAIRHPDRCVELINKHFAETFKSEDFTSRIDEAISGRLKRVNRQNQRNESNTSLPNPVREVKKQRYVELATNSHFYPACVKLYSKYVEHAESSTGTDQNGS